MHPALAGGLLALALAAGACARPEQPPATSASAAPAAAAAPARSAWCHALPLERSFCQALVVEAPRRTLRLAVADTDARREHGLMGVAAIPPGEGMLFAFPDAGQRGHEFWMKDTIVGLDMVFVRTDGTVTTVAADVPATKPGTPDDRIARRQGVGRFVIELAAGAAAAAGLRPGARLVLPEVGAE